MSDREDFDCPHCGHRFVWSEYQGEEKTVGSWFNGHSHVICKGCKRCCGCPPKSYGDWDGKEVRVGKMD